MAERARTEPTTNTVVLPGVSGRRLLRWHWDTNLSWVQEAKTCSEFVHEYTHHWSFHSLVYEALGILKVRMQLFCERLPGSRALFARDYVVVTAVERCLRPLLEGMAQFAEFDLWNSRDWHAFASPVAAAMVCFSRPGSSVSAECFLRVMRNSPEILRRKASLYLKPFETEREGYLPGYIAVKNIYLGSCVRYPDLTQEVFLSYLRHFVLNDPVLCAEILSADTYAPRVLQKIFQRIHDRLLALLTGAMSGSSVVGDEVATCIRKYEQSAQSTRKRYYDTEIGATEQSLELAVGRLNSIYHGTLEGCARGDGVGEIAGCTEANVLRFLESLPVSREHAVVASLDVDVVVQEATLCMVLAGDSFPVRHESAQQLNPGKYRLYAILQTYCSYFLLVLQGKDSDSHIVFEISGGVVPVPVSVMHRFAGGYFPDLVVARRLHRRFRTVGVETIRGEAVRRILDEADANVYRLYETLALAYVHDPSTRLALAATLKHRGLRPLFGRDVDGIRLLAGLSLVGSLAPKYNLASLARYYYGFDHSVAEILKGLAAIQGAEGAELLVHELDDETLLIRV